MSDDPDHFRSVLGHFPTSVTVVTGMSTEGPVGLTVGSFTSVSLKPQLVGFLPKKTSETWAAVAPSEAFCVNLLGRADAELCWKFARSNVDLSRFDGVQWTKSAAGSPILDRALAWIDCTVEDVVSMGDHYFVVGRVGELEYVGDTAVENQPLLFCTGALGQVAPAESLDG